MKILHFYFIYVTLFFFLFSRKFMDFRLISVDIMILV